MRILKMKWCCQTGLNCRPLHYQWSALPLSYGSMPGIEGNRPKWPPTRRPVLATRAPLAQARGQAGMGSKSSKMLGLLSTGCFNAVKPQGNPQRSPNAARFPTIRGRHSECPNHLLPRLCGVMSHCGRRRRNPLCSCDGAGGGAVPGSVKTCSTE